ncbi:DUF1921 domain-containing protein [Pseudomonas sp. 20P_3.2_Bac4]|nr:MULTISPECIES: glucan 1,4-alpha-maltotetraohydrolase domain-containing protein [unclassified Pseudomonas]MCU1734940.1 DUF1921 domain-containing protein [Pseudomonas sp. 20P_3.2_Bac4]MCU1743415.1 DUF1921 domain-containing protein [Pseudomonas sp. 20P_3.2_Bac5]
MKAAICSLLLMSLLGTHNAALAREDLQGNTVGSVRNDGGDEIILQGFHWNSSRVSGESWYTILAAKAATIAQDGFTAIWMPPPWRDGSKWADAASGTSGGGEGYFWQDFNKNSQYGSDDQLKQAAAALNKVHVKPIYDVVPNHMNGNFPGQEVQLPKGQNFWRDDCQPVSKCDDGEGFMTGDADLNTANPRVFEMFKDEFANLRDHYGAQGLRFDFVKGYAAERVDSWMQGFGTQGFCVGELWKAPNEYASDDWRSKASWQDALKDWSDRAHCTVFDFALKERMQNGAIADWRHGLNGNPDPRWREVAVTFVDNHDTGYSPGPNGGQHHWALPEERRNQAYAYILTSPGTPTVYWPDMYDWPRGELIRKLIRIRRDAGVKADSAISFLGNYSGLVARTTGGKGTLLIALGSNLSAAGAGFTSVLDADNGQIRVWRSAQSQASVEVTFTCNQSITQPGESVYVVGSSAELGEWKPAHAIRLTDTSAYPSWKGVVRVPDQQTLEWKCIVRREADANSEPRWQPGNNNVLKVGEGASSTGSF